MAQAEFFDFGEIDFNLAAARIGKHPFQRVKIQVRAEQIPRSELKTRGDHDHEASRQRTVRPHPAQQHLGITDLHEALAPPDAQAQRGGPQPVRKTPTHLVDALVAAEMTPVAVFVLFAAAGALAVYRRQID